MHDNDRYIVVQAFQPALSNAEGPAFVETAGWKACTTMHKRAVRASAVIGMSLVLWAMSGSTLSAAPTQNDVFKSIHDSVGEESDFDPKPIILLALGGGVLMLVFVAFNHRQQRTTTNKPVNNPNRLVKEILRDVPLKPAEMKQLRLLAESVQSQVGETPNPLTMVLCPSLLAKGLQSNPAKVDRKAVAQVVRKMKLQGLSKS